MLMNVANALLAGLDLSSCGAAQATQSAAGSTASSGGLFSGLGTWGTMLLPLIMIVVLIVVMIVPQRKRDKKVKEMLNALKPGDRVRTIGGIYGTIMSIKDETITLAIGSQRTEMVVTRWAIRQVEEVSVENDGEILA